LITLAWFVPDIVGAGTPLEGGETARAGGIEPLDGLEVLGRALAAPLAAAWLGVGLLLWRRREWLDRPLAILLAGAGAWIGLVALMAVAGFAGLPRFLAPATAVIAIAGGVGLARAGSAAELRYPIGAISSAALVSVALLVAVAGFGWRLAQIPGDLEVVERQTNSIEHLFDLVDETGAAPLLSCQDRVRMTRVREQTALAWKLDEPIAAVPIHFRPRYGVALSTKPIPAGDVFAHAGGWRATRLPCPAPTR
jgi:ABC-type multidrug transport system fused ATPase/permease subunit